MHDGVFRTRNLSTEERRLADRIQNHGLYSEEDRRQADELASLAAVDPFNKIPTEARQVAQALALSEQDVAWNMRVLLHQHRDEWRFFLDRVSRPGAWVEQLCR